MTAPGNRMTFRKYGRSYQLKIETVQHLEEILKLDESLWMANSAPVNAFVCDEAFLRFMDYDGNGRVRSEEVQRAIQWTLRMLSDRAGVEAGAATLRLAAVDATHEEGRRAIAGARRILANLGRPGDPAISLEEVRNRQSIVAAADANGDGVIPPPVAKDPEIAQFISDILLTVGGETDASQKSGIAETGLRRFLKDAQAFVAWSEQAQAPAGAPTPVLPLGAATTAAYAALQAVRERIDEYFMQCAAAAYDARVFESVRIESTHAESADALAARLRLVPIAAIRTDGVLDLTGPLNPLFEPAIRVAEEQVFRPLLGAEARTLSRAQWRGVTGAFDAYARWQAARPESPVAALGVEALRRYLEPRFRESVEALITADRAVAEEIAAGREVERLILYQQHLMEFVNNFVSFPRFYDPNARALFEIGTLIMDGRQLALNVKVEDRAGHAAIARYSRLYVLYLDLTSGTTGEKCQIATAVTNGGVGNLYVGKHGVFIWRDGRVWDAQVAQIIENPISLIEAFFMPFVRMGQMVQGQIERFAGSGQKLIESRVAQPVEQVTTAMESRAGAPVARPAAPAPALRPVAPATASGAARDLLMGGSVALAVLGSAFAYITSTLAKADGGIVLGVLAGMLLLVLIPTLLIAYIKLRMRDVGTLLEASGWAINGRLRLTRVMQGVFTRRPRLPRGAEKERLDFLKQYAEYARQPIVRIRGEEKARR